MGGCDDSLVGLAHKKSRAPAGKEHKEQERIIPRGFKEKGPRDREIVRGSEGLREWEGCPKVTLFFKTILSAAKGLGGDGKANRRGRIRKSVARLLSNDVPSSSRGKGRSEKSLGGSNPEKNRQGG